MEPNKVSFEYCHRWLYCSLKIGERHYTLFLVCGLITYITTFIVSAIPFVGSVASLLLVFVYFLAGMRLTQQIIKEPHTITDVDTFLRFTFDKDYVERFRTQFGILFGLGVLIIAFTYIRFAGLHLLARAVIYLATFLFSFSAFTILQHPSMHWRAALEKAFQGFTLNLGALACTVLLLGAAALVSLALCFVPFLLYFVPMTFAVGYLIYASIFESLDIEALITEWSSKTTIETHTLPPEA